MNPLFAQKRSKVVLARIRMPISSGIYVDTKMVITIHKKHMQSKNAVPEDT